MQRLYNVDKWTRLEEGVSIEFANPKRRNVKVEVNAPVETALHYIDRDTGEVHFLALVKGRDTIEFGTIGAYALTVEGGDCMIYTADGDDISQVVVAPVIFTKIAERRRRNPELEYIAATMQRNMERRLEQQAAELEQLFSRRSAALADVVPPQGVHTTVGGEPSQTGVTVSPGAPPPAPAGGTEGSAPAPVSGAGGTGGEVGVQT